MEATAKNVDKMTRTAREMAEAQRDSFEALAENFAAAQRRSMGLAEGGLQFVRLQEDNARAAQEFFATGVRLLSSSAPSPTPVRPRGPSRTPPGRASRPPSRWRARA